MNEYLLGKKLYGDDFSIGELERWYAAEAEGYADLGNKDKSNYKYIYHRINTIYGYSKLGHQSFANVLGFGSAWGYEFEPIIERIRQLTIVEPSDNLKSDKIGHIIPKYVKPEISGKLRFSSCSYDLITCFDTLHHVANVSLVLHELIRVLKPGGHLLIREPIVSMGDWNNIRLGLTKNERGIPLDYFTKFFQKEGVNIVSCSNYSTATALFSKTIGRFLKHPIQSYRLYVAFDKVLSSLLLWNIKYHAKYRFDRFYPQNVFYVIKK